MKPCSAATQNDIVHGAIQVVLETSVARDDEVFTTLRFHKGVVGAGEDFGVPCIEQVKAVITFSLPA